MSDDRLLRELGHLAREEKEAEQARLDERWDRLSRGELSSEEEAELRALAEASPEAGVAYAAFRPLGADFEARVAAALAAELQRPIAPQQPRPRLLPFRFPDLRRAGWRTAAAAAAAVAAVLVLFLRPQAPLPSYALHLSGGSSAMRGERPAGTAPDFAPGERFQVILRPQTAVSRARSLEAQCFLLRSRELRRLEVQRQLDAAGSVKMEGSMSRDLRPGTWTLWAVVGRRGELPVPADLRSFPARGEVRQRHWVAVGRDIRIRP